MMRRKDMINRMNTFGKNAEPFVFIIDFKGEAGVVLKTEELRENGIRVEMKDFKTGDCNHYPDVTEIEFERFPPERKKYKTAFDSVITHIMRGDTYLVNLTAPSRIRTTLTLDEIYSYSKVPYKLLFEDFFVVFSPEPFVRIAGNRISSYPMKGTARDDHPDAAEDLMLNQKELAEHNTIVDLLRSDLNRVAKKVSVNRFRYLEKIETITGPILQTSSEIEGILPLNWQENAGNILFELLPAGSVTGAPKQKTMEIILETEDYDRGFFTGIFGRFDGRNLDSAVMIRFIEKSGNDFFFKSGGGITSFSNWESEYRELIDKVYLAFAIGSQSYE